jgi:hypothetical protein
MLFRVLDNAAMSKGTFKQEDESIFRNTKLKDN